MKTRVLFLYCLLVGCSCIFAMQPNFTHIVCGDSYESVKNGERCSVHTIILHDSTLNTGDTIDGFALYWVYFYTSSYCDTCALKVDSIITLGCINRSSIELTEIQQKIIMDRGLKQIQKLHFWYYQYIPTDIPLRQQISLKFEISYGKNDEETTIVPIGNTLPVSNTANYYTIHDIFHRNCVYHAPTATSKDYAIEFVHNSKGYIRYHTEEEHYHFYYIKDHLGNIRETYVRPSANYKECIQRMQYYPSGLPWNTNYVANEQPYKYGSKEFVEMHGLDEYDSYARWYYPALARTTTMDPHSEDYYPISPYAWCGNNFVNNVDKNGMYFDRVNEQYAQQIEENCNVLLIHVSDKHRIKELSKTLNDIQDMRNDSEHEFRFGQASTDENGILAPETSYGGKNEKGHSIINMFSDIDNINETTVHETRHGGQIARKELLVDANGSWQNYGVQKEIDAYRAQWGWNGVLQLYVLFEGQQFGYQKSITDYYGINRQLINSIVSHPLNPHLLYPPLNLDKRVWRKN